MLKVLFWPIDLALRLISLILGMTGRVMSLVLGLILCGIGAFLCASLIGLVAGVPLIIFGGALIFRCLF